MSRQPIRLFITLLIGMALIFLAINYNNPLWWNKLGTTTRSHTGPIVDPIVEVTFNFNGTDCEIYTSNVNIGQHLQIQARSSQVQMVDVDKIVVDGTAYEIRSQNGVVGLSLDRGMTEILIQKAVTQ